MVQAHTMSDAEVDMNLKITLTWDDLNTFLHDGRIEILLEDYNYYIEVSIIAPRKLPAPKWMTDIFTRVKLPGIH